MFSEEKCVLLSSHILICDQWLKCNNLFTVSTEVEPNKISVLKLVLTNLREVDCVNNKEHERLLTVLMQTQSVKSMGDKTVKHTT